MNEPLGSVTSGRVGEANQLVNRFSKYAAVGGLLPLPFLDMAAIAAVQLKMLASLSELYGVPFKKNVAKELIGTILGVGVSYNFGNAALLTVGPYLRLVPVGGVLLGAAVIPAVAAATTNALGRIFVGHFESGGHLLDLDVASAKRAFREDFARKAPPHHATDIGSTDAALA